jgi:hypothetical protein
MAIQLPLELAREAETLTIEGFDAMAFFTRGAAPFVDQPASRKKFARSVAEKIPALAREAENDDALWRRTTSLRRSSGSPSGLP